MREVRRASAVSIHKIGNDIYAEGKHLVSLRQLAQEWDCSRNTVRRVLARAGVYPYFLSDGRNGTLRYDRAEVDAFLNRCKGKEVNLGK
jgi:DNA-binding transcriptional MocR family regulator